MIGIRIRAAALVVGSLSAVGCTQDTSPTEPGAATASRLASSNAVVRSTSQSTDVLKIPVSFTIRPAAKLAIQACLGEIVTFVGDANFVTHQTTLPDGSISLDFLHFNGQGAVAIGASTGATYRLVGADSNPVVLTPSGGLTATFDANLLAVGSGGNKSFMAHVIQHITITPNGDITALVDLASIECR